MQPVQNAMKLLLAAWMSTPFLMCSINAEIYNVRSGYNLEYVTTFLPANSISKALEIDYWTTFEANKIVFILQDETKDADRSLWITDGTETGTYPLKEDFCIRNRVRKDIAVYNDMIYFWASDSCNSTSMDYDTELWVSDGTGLDATFKLKDVNPHGSSSPSQVGKNEHITFFKDKTYFITTDAIDTAESRDGTGIWFTDGTIDGTQPVPFVDKFKAYGSYSIEHMSSLNDDALVIYVFAESESHDLWFSDGTYEGTLLQRSFPASHYSLRIKNTVEGDGLYFSIVNSLTSTEDLWVTDGSIRGTHLLRSFDSFVNIGPNRMTNGKFIMVASDRFHGRELWATDGTPDGTVVVKDIVRGPDGSSPLPIGRVGEEAILQPQEIDVNGLELWKTDGTASGTHLLQNLYPDADESVDYYLVNSELFVDDSLLLSVENTDSDLDDLWVSDGTAAGTLKIAEMTETKWFKTTLSGAAILASTNGLALDLWTITKAGTCSEEDDDKFFWKVNPTGKNIVKDCEWLKTRSNKKNICRKTLSGVGFPPAREVCRVTCETC